MNAKATKAKAQDLSAKTPDELRKLLIDTRKAQFNLRFQQTGGTLENVAEIKKNRRNIARIKTFLHQKEVTPQKAAKKAAKKAATPKAAKKATPKAAAKPKKQHSAAKRQAKATPKKRTAKTAAKKSGSKAKKA
jgi:large subunit ribosomal protein L29